MSGCGAIFRRSCRPRPRPACWSIRAPAMAPRRRQRCRARSITCISRRARCCPKLLDAIGFRRGILVGHSDGASIAAIYAGSHQDHRVQGVAMIAPHFIVEDISVSSIAEIKRAYETDGAQGKAFALAQGRRQRLLRLERRLARPQISLLGYFGIPRLYTRAGCDPAGGRRSVWDNPTDRDCQGRVLLSGRCDGYPGGWTFAASRGAGEDAEYDLGFCKTHFIHA